MTILKDFLFVDNLKSKLHREQYENFLSNANTNTPDFLKTNTIIPSIGFDVYLDPGSMKIGNYAHHL